MWWGPEKSPGTVLATPPNNHSIFLMKASRRTHQVFMCTGERALWGFWTPKTPTSWPQWPSPYQGLWDPGSVRVRWGPRVCV